LRCKKLHKIHWRRCYNKLKLNSKFGKKYRLHRLKKFKRKHLHLVGEIRRHIERRNRMDKGFESEKLKVHKLWNNPVFITKPSFLKKIENHLKIRKLEKIKEQEKLDKVIKLEHKKNLKMKTLTFK